MRVIMALVAGAALSATGLGAVEPSTEEPPPGATVELEDIEVVAPPLVEQTEVDRFGGMKSTVTGAQIRDLNAQDAAAALRTVPGVTISRYNPIGAFGGGEGGAVFIRGMGSSRPGGEIQMLIDGVPVYNPLWNHALLDLNPINGAQAIEVYKGVQPAVFGNGFGAINMVPKHRTSEGFETALHGAYGSYNTYVETAEHAGKIGRLDYFVGQGLRRSDGHRHLAGGRLLDFRLGGGYALSDEWSARVFLLRTDNFAQDPGPRRHPELREGVFGTEEWLTTFAVANRYEKARGDIKFYWNNGAADWRNQAGPADDTLSRWDLYGLRGRETFDVWFDAQFTIGADLDWMTGGGRFTTDSGGASRFDRKTFFLASPYTSLSRKFEHESGCYLTPSAGLRYYAHNEFDPEPSPHAGVVLGYAGTELHASYARGVNYPGLNTVVFGRNVIPALGESWKDLDPELLDHYEVGLTQKFGDYVKIDAAAFYEDGRDRYVIVPPPPPPPVFDNVEKFRIRGAEALVTVFPLRDVAVFAGGTYLDPDPSDLPYAPRWTYSGGVTLRLLEAFRISTDMQYVDEMQAESQARRAGAKNDKRVDSYFLLSAKLAYLFSIPGSKTEGEIFVAGENLTNERYEYRPGYPMPRANVMGGLTLRF
ncbi:MAG: vitamin B12/cobalamin outer membrane transporter [Planctomycetes bacterium ADurb.Bin069]|nr:MAG: vitamin B12/cobalamin outer membrane transporter [Planctomycetes bacterium ADurb.Bin069]